jgi:hypothetical protein
LVGFSTLEKEIKKDYSWRTFQRQLMAIDYRERVSFDHSKESRAYALAKVGPAKGGLH